MPQSDDQLREKRVELILQQLEDLPALPRPAADALRLGPTQSGALIQLISADVRIAERVLLLLRGLHLKPDAPLESFKFEASRDAFIAVFLFQVLQGHPGGQQVFKREEFWKHSIAVAAAAELIGEHLAIVWGKACDVTPSELFLAGLLHDVGKLALDIALPKSFARVVEAVELLRGDIADVERTVIGLDHMVAGKRLAEQWELPGNIRDVIWLHGQAPDALPPTVACKRLVNSITLADILAREQHLGYSGNYLFAQSKQALAESIGLTGEQLADVVARLAERIGQRGEALGLGQASSTDVYKDALQRANRELDRVAGQIESKNRRLALRARFFNELSELKDGLQPDASPQQVMRAIGATAVSFLEITSCCVFSGIPGQNYAEAMLFDAQGELFETTLVDCLKRPMPPQPGEGPVLPAGSEMEWLLAAISPRLAHEQRYWVCLDAENLCVGGILWGAPAGESARLGQHVQELTALTHGWSLSLRTAQIREEARTLAEKLAETNRRLQNAQSEIVRARMMGAVGEMAAGAAHEMNNPLAVISGRSQLLAKQLEDVKQKAAANLIAEQAHRITDIITELMDFAKPEPPRPEEIEVAELIERALHKAKLHNDTADRNIEVTLGDVPNVVVDRDQLMEALVEIIENALSATDPKKGQIHLHAAFDAFSLRVAVTISDNGVGMDEATLKRAFDPFFSNRPAGRRRGMGLAKAQRWIEASGGSIRLESRPGAGTRAVILLPAAKPARQSRDRRFRQA